MTEGFHFYTQHNLVELLENIKNVPTASIYYHTHRFI
jgi:hypothetical protein